MTRLAALGVASLYRAYYATLRVHAVLPDGRVIRGADYPMGDQIYAACERDALALCGLMARRQFVVLVAHGRDGDWASALLAAIGCRVVRGSTRRGGTRALLTILRALDTSTIPVGIVVDGPLGPAGVAKPGVILCGLKSGRPVRALGAAARWKLTLPRTWSGIYVPLPFSTVVVTYDTAAVSSGATEHVRVLTDRLTHHLACARGRAHAMLQLKPEGVS